MTSHDAKNCRVRSRFEDPFRSRPDMAMTAELPGVALGQPYSKRRDGAKTAQRVRVRVTRCAVDLKRVYEQPSSGDGARVLVDRLWPRGLSRKQLAVDFWLKDVAPSDALRRWFGHQPRRWKSFAAKYRTELAQRIELLRLLDELRNRGRVTLLYSARDANRNNAVVLREVIEERDFIRKKIPRIGVR